MAFALWIPLILLCLPAGVNSRTVTQAQVWHRNHGWWSAAILPRSWWTLKLVITAILGPLPQTLILTSVILRRSERRGDEWTVPFIHEQTNGIFARCSSTVAHYYGGRTARWGCYLSRTWNITSDKIRDDTDTKSLKWCRKCGYINGQSLFHEHYVRALSTRFQLSREHKAVLVTFSTQIYSKI